MSLNAELSLITPIASVQNAIALVYLVMNSTGMVHFVCLHWHMRALVQAPINVALLLKVPIALILSATAPKFSQMNSSSTVATVSKLIQSTKHALQTFNAEVLPITFNVFQTNAIATESMEVNTIGMEVIACLLRAF